MTARLDRSAPRPEYCRCDLTATGAQCSCPGGERWDRPLSMADLPAETILDLMPLRYSDPQEHARRIDAAIEELRASLAQPRIDMGQTRLDDPRRDAGHFDAAASQARRDAAYREMASHLAEAWKDPQYRRGPIPPAHPPRPRRVDTDPSGDAAEARREQRQREYADHVRNAWRATAQGGQ